MFCRFRQGYNALRLHHSGLADSWKHGTPLRQPSRFKGNPLHEHFASPRSCNGSSQRDLRRSLWQQVCFFSLPAPYNVTMLECVGINLWFVTFKCLVCPVRCPHLFTLSPSSNAFVYLCLLVLRGGFNPLEQRCGWWAEAAGRPMLWADLHCRSLPYTLVESVPWVL